MKINARPSVSITAAGEDLTGAMESTFNTSVTPYVRPGAWKTMEGEVVFEVRTDTPWDKGKAIAYLQDAYRRAYLIFHFGDDLTFEDGFEMVQSSGGIAIFGGQARQPTKTLYRLDSLPEVLETLRLIERL